MRKEAILWSCAALLIFGAMSRAGDQRPYIGVSLDATPLPELLTKHLQLEPKQGLRITNIMTGGPAEKAGLDRDDLIIVFQGAKVTSLDQFVEALRGAGVGAEVSLEVIHLGQHKTVHPKLEPAPDEKNVSWKYPPEPDAITSWHPRRLFKIGLDGKQLEIPFDKIPDIDGDFRRFLKESYTYHHATDGEEYTITIEGDPADEDSELVVQVGDKKYPATVGSIEALPQKYREPARQAVEDARSSVEKDIHVPWPEGWGREARRKFFEGLPKPDLQRLFDEKDSAVEKLQDQVERLQQRLKEMDGQKLQEQMEQLQQRVKEMEERSREMLDKLLPNRETKKSASSEPPLAAPEEAREKPAL